MVATIPQAKLSPLCNFAEEDEIHFIFACLKLDHPRKTHIQPILIPGNPVFSILQIEKKTFKPCKTRRHPQKHTANGNSCGGVGLVHHRGSFLFCGICVSLPLCWFRASCWLSSSNRCCLICLSTGVWFLWDFLEPVFGGVSEDGCTRACVCVCVVACVRLGVGLRVFGVAMCAGAGASHWRQY